MSASSQTRPPRPISDLVVPLARLESDIKQLVVRQRLAALDTLREQLPLDDPDRHALDVTADRAFAQLACQQTGGTA